MGTEDWPGDLTWRVVAAALAAAVAGTLRDRMQDRAERVVIASMARRAKRPPRPGA